MLGNLNNGNSLSLKIFKQKNGGIFNRKESSERKEFLTIQAKNQENQGKDKKKVCMMHVSGFKGKNQFCRKCGIYMPKTGSTAYREVFKVIDKNINPNDEYQFMIQKQQKNRIFNPESSSLVFRDELIKIVKKWAISFKVSAMSLYTAISFVDSILGRWEIYKDSVEILALICLLIASKFHETCDQSSKTRKIYNVCKQRVGEKNILKYESLVSNILEWDFDIQTPLHFVNFYLSRGVIFSSDKTYNKPLNRLLNDIRIFASRATFLALSDYSFYHFTSLAVAACSIGLARMEHGIRPLWPQELESLSWIPWSSVETCFLKLLKCMNLTEKFESYKTMKRIIISPPLRRRTGNRFYRKGARTCVNRTPEKMLSKRAFMDATTDIQEKKRKRKKTSFVTYRNLPKDPNTALDDENFNGFTGKENSKFVVKNFKIQNINIS